MEFRSSGNVKVDEGVMEDEVKKRRTRRSRRGTWGLGKFIEGQG